MPNMVNIESLKLMMPDSLILKQNKVWGIHDFCLESMQACQTFNDRIEKSFGPLSDVSKWLIYSQWVNYEGHRAIFEAQSKYRMGALLWMSHPAWPSLVWQTYDYYLEPTAAYFGVKKACEPLHILFNPLNDSIEVANNNFGIARDITARIELIDLYGKTLWKQESYLSCSDDSRLSILKIDRSKVTTEVFYLRLTLLQDSNELSNNFYICGSENGNLKAVNSLKNSRLTVTTTEKAEDDNIVLLSTISNISDTPALMVRLKAVGGKSGDRILPVLYSDNYISLIPGESRTVRIEVKTSDTRGEKPKIVIDGLNIKQ
jgi:hypothetical protein